MADLRELPMFPLGTVLLPSALLPLQIFEPRYRAMLQDVLKADACFGIVLIERGSEVGGGDTRCSVGTVARVVRVGQSPDGRYLLVVIGAERLRVEEWLPDDPYPRARVEILDDEHAAEASDDLLHRATRALVRVRALRTELGHPGPPADVGDDDAASPFRLAAMAGLSPHDAYRLLRLDTGEERMTLLVELLEDEASLLELQLGSGG